MFLDAQGGHSVAMCRAQSEPVLSCIPGIGTPFCLHASNVCCSAGSVRIADPRELCSHQSGEADGVAL